MYMYMYMHVYPCIYMYIVISSTLYLYTIHITEGVMEPESTEREPEVTQPVGEGVEPSEETGKTEDVVKPKPTRTKVRSTNPGDGPDIAMGDSGLAAVDPITIGEMMKLTVSKVPDRVGLSYKRDKEWIDITFQQYYDMSVAAAKSFLKVQLHVYIYPHIHVYVHVHVHANNYMYRDEECRHE